MKAKDFVLSKYPKATAFPMMDNQRMHTSYVIIKHGSFEDFPKIDLEIFTNEGATTASKAWTNAKKEILKNNNTWVRKNNNSISDEVLDLMKNAVLEYETLKKQTESLSCDVNVLAIDNNDLEKQNALLVEKLSNLLNKISESIPMIDTSSREQRNLYLEYHSAKELLNNLKK